METHKGNDPNIKGIWQLGCFKMKLLTKTITVEMVFSNKMKELLLFVLTATIQNDLMMNQLIHFSFIVNLFSLFLGN